jgi:hypothetical protein
MTDRIVLNIGQDVEQLLAYALAQIAIRYRLSDAEMTALLIRQLAEWQNCGEKEKAA